MRLATLGGLTHYLLCGISSGGTKMKKVKIISLLLVLVMAISLCACSSEETTEQKESVQFGTFGYNGAVLTDYAVSAITAEKAKEILPLSNNK